MQFMLREITVKKRGIEDYAEFVDKDFIPLLKRSAVATLGKKILHINSTPVGGGVAEMLKSLVPLERGLGMDSRWYTMDVYDPDFFMITKKLYNSLQGNKGSLDNQEKEKYIKINEENAVQLNALMPDIVIVHDPQPLATIHSYHGAPMISRMHIDLSTPNPSAIKFIMPYLCLYDLAVFSIGEFVPGGLSREKIKIQAPAIDPLSEKNKATNPDEARSILKMMGVDIDRPIMAQVSRFDVWKDPVGVIQAYYFAKSRIPDLQLVLLGNIQSQDDPEATNVFHSVRKYAGDNPDIFLFQKPPNEDATNDIMVRTVQSAADVVLQKSIREGFGLTVTEAMWQGKPVIGGDVGGIRKQIENGVNGFLVSSPEEAAERTVELIKNPQLAREMGKKANESVRKNFLITRLLGDYVEMYQLLLRSQQSHPLEN